jgi:uncharacterized protein (TIGR02246 family)
MIMTTATKVRANSAITDEKVQVRKVLDDLMAAIASKDIKRMMTLYASDVVAFDVKPPFQTLGAVAWKHTWEACFPYFPDSFRMEMRDVKIFANADLAFAHYIFRIADAPKEHDAGQTWIRGTTCLKKQQGKWKIVHEHGSVPFHPHTMQAVFTLER